MEFLYLLEKIRLPGLNEILLAITTLGEETAFLVIGLFVFWCVNKRWGYYVMSVGFLGNILSQFMKILCRIPRPWVLDPKFTILEQAREAASGYSFPSGHTQSAVGTLGAIAKCTGTRWLRVICITLAALVGFSRMYLGVHTPADVLVGAAMSIVFIFALYPLMFGKADRTLWVLAGISLLSIAYLVFMHTYPCPADIDIHNYESAMKNSYTLLGATIGLTVVYPLEKRFVNFQEKAPWTAQVLKFLLGLVVVLAVKEGMRGPLDALFAGHLAARSVRYFMIVLVAGLIWPVTFQFFSKIGNKKCNCKN